VSTERKRLEAKVAELERRNADVVRQLHEAQTELSHARSKATSVAEKAAAEREAHNTWQAHVDATLDHCRQRLVARTEQIYQVTKLQQQPVAVENGGTAEDGGMIMTAEGHQGEVASIAAALRREREGGLCSVCVGAPKSAVLLPCRHELCESCAAVVSAHSGRCPLCREPVASVSDLRYLTCQVCFDDHPAIKGIECSGAGEARAGGGEAEGEGGGGSEGAKHFLCDDCLSSHVCAAIDSGSIDAFAQRGGVCCVHLGCTAPPFAETALARALPEEVPDADLIEPALAPLPAHQPMIEPHHPWPHLLSLTIPGPPSSSDRCLHVTRRPSSTWPSSASTQSSSVASRRGWRRSTNATAVSRHARRSSSTCASASSPSAGKHGPREGLDAA
jgi:hypothetical protein